MDNKKFYTREKEVSGKKYVAQFNGLSCAVRAVDQSHMSENNDSTSVEKFANYLFENVIVEPKGLTIDDFDSMEEFNEVTAFARDVMQGKFRDETPNKAAAKKKGE